MLKLRLIFGSLIMIFSILGVINFIYGTVIFGDFFKGVIGTICIIGAVGFVCINAITGDNN